MNKLAHFSSSSSLIKVNQSLDGQEAQQALLLLSRFLKNGNDQSVNQDILMRQSLEEGSEDSGHGGVEATKDDLASFSAHHLQKDLDDKLLKLHQDFIASFEGVYLVRCFRTTYLAVQWLRPQLLPP